MFNFLTQRLKAQKDLHRFRQRTLSTTNVERPSYIDVDGKSYLNFSSNDYLGLNNHVKIKQALQDGADQYGLCSTGSSLITGYNYAHQALEATICHWLNKPKCLLFTSGFAANSGVLQALGDQHCQFYLDKLSHASLIDGAYGSKANVKRFLHNDLAQLTQWLNKAQSTTDNTQQDSLIVSEGVFSMDGDQAEVKQLAQLAQQHNALLYLDDAHSIGVLGEKGQGSCAQANVDIVMATFGKAIATSGAFVACDETLFDYLVNFGRHYIYSTAMSPAMAWATKASIELIQQEQWRGKKIIELSQLFIAKLDNCFEVLPSNSSIHAIIIGSEEKTLQASQLLKEQGIWLTAIRPPTVANNKSRLRVTICANHNVKDIMSLVDSLHKVSEKLKD
jgi:8-amino-7-oxononanoate synthase